MKIVDYFVQCRLRYLEVINVVVVTFDTRMIHRRHIIGSLVDVFFVDSCFTFIDMFPIPLSDVLL